MNLITMDKCKKHIYFIRHHIKDNILNERKEIRGHELERDQIYNLIKKTIEYGESNSALLIGPRGSGKTTLLTNVLGKLYRENEVKQNSFLVKLHGLIHTDDKLALKAITTQMQLDNAVNGKVFGSFAENLTFLLACLRSGQRETSKSVIFIIEEFDLFCNHQNQTLLYNLFDVSQSAQAPICVIGMTCRLDVIELLEKRVKSRFSHRQIFLLAPERNDLKAYINYIKHTLHLKSEHAQPKNDIKKLWNKHIDELFEEKRFIHILERIWNIDNNKHTIMNILFSVACNLNENHYLMMIEHFEKELNNFEEDDMILILKDLNVLELCLVIAIMHHCEIFDNQPLNFEMIYSRLSKFASANSNLQLLQRPVIMKAFEHLENLEIIVPISRIGKNLQKEYQMFKLLLNKSQIMEAVTSYNGLPTEILQWANSSLL